MTPRHLQNTFSVNATTFDELTPLLNKYSGAYTVAGLIGFMSALKIFKYVCVVPCRWCCAAVYLVVRSCVCGVLGYDERVSALLSWKPSRLSRLNPWAPAGRNPSPMCG